MPEVEGQIEAPAAAGTTPVPATSVVNADGTFVEKWTDKLDEDLRSEKSLQLHKSIQSLAKSYVNAQKMVGKGKVAIPTETSTEGEWNEYFKAGGRPDLAADYGLKVPEGVPEEVFPKEKLTKWQERFFKAGISKKAATEILNQYAADISEDIQAMNNDRELSKKELVDGLQKDWGRAYDQNLHIANLAVEEGVKGDDEFKTRLTDKFGNDPDFIRFTANLGSKFAEAKMIDATIPTPSDLQTQIDDIMRNPLYTKGTQAQRLALSNKAIKLREQMVRVAKG